MAGYIDVDKAQAFLRLDCLVKYPSTFANGLFAAADQLKNLPTADVQEVKHGEWKEIKCGDGMFDYCFICSECSGTTPSKAYAISPNYCPRCGAKMDGGKKE